MNRRCFPFSAAMDAMQFMGTYYSAAPGTGPPGLFLPDKFPDSAVLYILKIFHHAHAVFCPVPFVQVLQPVAGEQTALGAESGFVF